MPEMSQVHLLPTGRKPGRRRINPISGAPLAPVLAFDSGSPIESPAQRLAKMDQVATRLARAMLDAIRATREITRLLDEVRDGK
jgi:hypothetical protein